MLYLLFSFLFYSLFYSWKGSGKAVNIFRKHNYYVIPLLSMRCKISCFAFQKRLFYYQKVPILYNSLIISTYEIEKRKRVTIWLLLKFPGLP